MILKQICGSKITFLLFLYFFISCNTYHKYYKYNFFNGSEYYNDSLKIAANLFADIRYSNPTKSKIRKNINKFKFLASRDLLIYGKAILEPKYELFLFCKENRGNSIIMDSLLLNDTHNNMVLYKKKYKNQEYHLLLKADETSKTNSSILSDSKSIIESIVFDATEENRLTYMKLFNTYKNESNILFVMNKFITAPIEPSKQNEWSKFQLLSTILSNDSEYPLYKKLLEEFDSKRKEKIAEDLKKIIKSDSLLNKLFKNENVINEIEKLSAKSNLVMLNEMHWKPEHRILAKKLLIPLKNNGYNYLAVEAVDKKQDSLINKNKYPITSTGYYTREPYFSLFLREALELGFEIVSYDDFETENREKTQALNIKAIFDKDPLAKVFVYAGIDHISENSNKERTKRMAEYFKELTKIDPLTIDQVKLVSEEQVDSLILLQSDRFDDSELMNISVDYLVINNIKPSLNHFNSYKTFPYVIEDVALFDYNNSEVYLSLFIAKEYSKYKNRSVAIFNRICKIQNNKISLDLPQGNYQLMIKDANNNLILSKIIEIIELK